MRRKPEYTAESWKQAFKNALLCMGFDETFAEDSATANPMSDWAGWEPEDAAREEVSYAD